MNEQQQKLLQAYHSVKPYIEVHLENVIKDVQQAIDNNKVKSTAFADMLQEQQDKVKNALDVIKNTEAMNE